MLITILSFTPLWIDWYGTIIIIILPLFICWYSIYFDLSPKIIQLFSEVSARLEKYKDYQDPLTYELYITFKDMAKMAKEHVNIRLVLRFTRTAHTPMPFYSFGAVIEATFRCCSFMNGFKECL